jgi:hypothetical protein
VGQLGMKQLGSLPGSLAAEAIEATGCLAMLP